MTGILIVAFLLGFKLMVHTWLMLRQYRAMSKGRNSVPSSFAQHFTLEQHQKAIDYGKARLSFVLARLWFSGLILALWFFTGALNFLDSLLFFFVPSSTWQPIALIASVGLVEGILGMPWSIYSQFVLEEKFGFNRTTWGTFFSDRIKGIALGSVFGLMLGYPLIWLMQNMPGIWWIPAYVVYTCFQILLLWLFPTVIAPLFNKFSPLEDKELATGINDLVVEAGFKSQGVFVMDASKRSSHGNAYFTGIGKAKRIVFFDTLLKTLKPQETLAVLAHEIGHLAHGHIKKGLILSLVMTAVAFFALGWFATRADLFIDLGLSPTHGVVLLVASWLGGLISVPLSPLMSRWSRKHEFEADRYAVKRSSAKALSEALICLYRENAGSLIVDPLYAAWNYSHPPLSERVQAMHEN
jgi:STE24 endopeptidase